MTTLKTAIEAVLVLTMLVLGAYAISHAQSPQLATQYSNQAQEAEKSGRYLEAARLYEKSSLVEIKSPKPRLHSLIAELGQAGYCYNKVGQYDNSLKYYEMALAIARKLGKESDVAILINNSGDVYKEWGQYDKALKCYEEALAINRKLGREDYVVIALNNIGMVYRLWGQYDKAFKYFEESMAIARKLGKESLIASCLLNIGVIYREWGQYSKALKYFEESLAIDKKLGREDHVAINLNNIGDVYREWGQYDKALNNNEMALSIARKLGREDHVASYLLNIGSVYYLRGQYNKALKYYQEALAINRKLGREDHVVTALNNIGWSYSSLNQYSKAIDSFRESITLIEKLRKTATGDARRDYLTSQIGRYSFLIILYLRMNDLPNAFSVMEISRAKLLAERLAGSDSMSPIPTIQSIQMEIPADTAIISFANINKDEPVVLVITKDNMTGAELDKKKFIDSIQDAYKRPIEQLLARQRGLKVIRKSAERDQKLQGKSATSFDDVVNYYRSLMTDASSGINRSGRGIVVAGKPGDPNSAARLDRLLHDFLIQPLAKILKGKRRLIIIPDGVLSYLPFETLVDENNNYLVEKYAISYVQSMGVMEMLKKRIYPAGRKSMLAFGGAVYDEVSYAGNMIANEQQLLALAKDVYATTRSRGSLGSAYSSLGIAKWDNLPGTLNEVAAIAKTVKGAEVITGRDVTESSVKGLSTSGELSKYKVIHFATHGIVVPEIPELSAIVLSQLKNQPAGEDGYLRMDKIEELRMKADFVNLSACETGLGKIFGGEGVVGLTQSFLLAGANGLSASLWSVNDVSTSQFMVALYSMVEQKQISYGDAVTEIKRDFIQGKFGDRYKAPYYWAPFVYYGFNSDSLSNPVKQVAMGPRPSVDGGKETSMDKRFIAYDNGTVLDTKTSLMWATKDNGSNIDWATAKSFSENYRGGGYSDWRMPTQDELAGLYDSAVTGKNGFHLNKWIELTGFCPWASETRGSEAAGFSFSHGIRFWNQQILNNFGVRALPVRSGKSEGSSALKLPPERSNSVDTANKLKRNDLFITTVNGTVEKKRLKIEDDRERLATKQGSERPPPPKGHDLLCHGRTSLSNHS